MKKLLYVCLPVLLLGTACKKQPATTTATTTIQNYNQFEDASLRKIHDLKDERNSVGLLVILERPEVIYRREAVLALASVQNKPTGNALLRFLRQDAEPEVRKAAAYAVGQLADSTLQDLLIQAVQAEENATVKAEILEALGKSATKPGIEFLSVYKATGPIEKTGQAWGLYRAAIRKAPASDKTLLKVIELIEAPEKDTRHAAAQFLARAPKIDFNVYYNKLSTIAQNDPEVEVRIVATQALGKTKSDNLAADLTKILQKQEDYRVHISAIRAMQSADYEAGKKAVLDKLETSNPNVAVAAAEYFKAKATEEDGAELVGNQVQVKNLRARILLYEIGLKLFKDNQRVIVGKQLKTIYLASQNSYTKGYTLQALAKDPSNFDFIKEQTFNAKDNIISTYGMEALADMAKAEAGNLEKRRQFADIFKAAIETGDVAMVGLAAGAIRNQDNKLQDAYKETNFLKTAAGKLNLPRDIETYQELLQTIAYLNNKEAETIPRPKATNPINWEVIKTLKPDQKVLLKTRKGDITFQLYVNEAPGSVANFVELVNKGFYNGKNFHRVVPNFVAQGGDPRGDGWGSSDQTIRSEFAPLHYETGTVGMASAGKDTESCQWFITHTPTPHLDGRYSIFAKVVSGMEVVHRLEIGDVIEEVTLVN